MPSILPLLMVISEQNTIRIHPDGYRSWNMCNNAEAFFDTAIRKRTLIRASNFAVKTVDGKIGAICLDDREISEGTYLHRGGIYCPIDDATIQALHTAFDEGEPFAELQAVSEWAYMRDLRENRLFDGRRAQPEQLIQQAKALALSHRRNLPERIDGKDRFTYRIANERSHWSQD